MVQCIVCGKMIERSRWSHKVLCSQECYSRDFWNDTLDESAIIIDGVCYHDAGRKSEGYRGFLGYGGREFKIQMNDGRVIETNNLWCQGSIPSSHERSDNAKFL